jgi:hypothetical protein
MDWFYYGCPFHLESGIDPITGRDTIPRYDIERAARVERGHCEMTVKTLLCGCERLILLSTPLLYAMYLRIRCQTCIIQIQLRVEKKGSLIRVCANRL